MGQVPGLARIARTSSASRRSCSRPSRPAPTGRGAAFKAKGIDVTPFTEQVKDRTTFLFPLTENGAAISQIMTPAMDNVMNFSADLSSLTDANDQVNALFQ